MTAKKNIRILLVAMVILTVPALAALADGSGGMFWGRQSTGYPFLPDAAIKNNSMGLSYVGGYGYGVRGHEITGGFGYAINDGDSQNGTAGGFGGVISGFRLIYWPVNVSLISWTGIGGMRTAEQRVAGEEGYFLLLEEITLEFGVPITRWFMPSVYAGYQFIGNLAPGEPFSDFFTYNPVIGFRVSWGKFY